MTPVRCAARRGRLREAFRPGTPVPGPPAGAPVSRRRLRLTPASGRSATSSSAASPGCTATVASPPATNAPPTSTTHSSASAASSSAGDTSNAHV